MKLAHCSGGRRQSSQQANTGVSVASCRFKLPQKVLGTPALPARQAAGDHYPRHPRKQLQKEKKKSSPLTFPQDNAEAFKLSPHPGSIPSKLRDSGEKKKIPNSAALCFPRWPWGTNANQASGTA